MQAHNCSTSHEYKSLACETRVIQYM